MQVSHAKGSRNLFPYFSKARGSRKSTFRRVGTVFAMKQKFVRACDRRYIDGVIFRRSLRKFLTSVTYRSQRATGKQRNCSAFISHGADGSRTSTAQPFYRRGMTLPGMYSRRSPADAFIHARSHGELFWFTRPPVFSHRPGAGYQFPADIGKILFQVEARLLLRRGQTKYRRGGSSFHAAPEFRDSSDARNALKSQPSLREVYL